MFTLFSGRVAAMLTVVLPSEHMPQPAYNNLCWSQVESDEARRHLYFHWSVNFYFYLGERQPYLQRPLFQTYI
jgi:hypothetical protein